MKNRIANLQYEFTIFLRRSGHIAMSDLNKIIDFLNTINSFKMIKTILVLMLFVVKTIFL